MATRTINVTQRDIERGRRFRCEACPIARAATRAFHRPMQAGFRICDAGQDMMFATEFVITPDDAMQWMHAFDMGYPVEPFKFQVESDGY